MLHPRQINPLYIGKVNRITIDFSCQGVNSPAFGQLPTNEMIPVSMGWEECICSWREIRSYDKLSLPILRALRLLHHIRNKKLWWSCSDIWVSCNGSKSVYLNFFIDCSWKSEASSRVQMNFCIRLRMEAKIRINPVFLKLTNWRHDKQWVMYSIDFAIRFWLGDTRGFWQISASTQPRSLGIWSDSQWPTSR